MLKAKPLGKNVLIQRAKSETEKTEGGLFISGKTNAVVARVLAIGPEVTSVGEFDEIIVSPKATLAVFSSVMPDVGLIAEEDILSKLERSEIIAPQKPSKLMLVK